MSKLLVLGNGAREHIIIEKLSESPKVSQIFTYNNSYFDKYNNEIVNIYGDDKNKTILYICQQNEIDFVVIGPEIYLVEGLVDLLESNNIKSFGPTQDCALIEGSKRYSKNLMKELELPTADYKVFDNKDDANEFLKNNFNNNYVLKLSGLAGGKGVFIPETLEEAINITNKVFESNYILIIEEKLYGEEVSVLGFCNGYEIELMPQAQDYKRIYDNDRGPNTGGMGSICPVNVLSDNELLLVRKYMNKIVKKLGYIGVLYAGIMKSNDGFYFLEFNCRFGDPEAQVILNLLDSDLYEIMLACYNKVKIPIKWKKKYASNVVLAHEDYPYSKLTNPIQINIGKLDKNIKLYYANVDNEYYTTGGRVLSVTCVDDNLFTSINSIYNNIYKIYFRGAYYRRDIGLNVLLKQKLLYTPKIAILGSTNGTSSLQLLEMINNNELNAKVNVIITNRKNSGIMDKAKKFSIPFVYLPKKKNMSNENYDKLLVNILRCYDIDIVFMIGYMRIVTNALIDEYNDRLLNIHPSLLPKYGGLMDLNVHKKILEHKEKFSGCTLHIVTEEVDKGKIILQSQCKIQYNDEMTEDVLKKHIQKLESQCIVNCVRIYSSFKLNYSVDIDKGNEFVELLKKDDKEIGGFCSIVEYNDNKLGLATDGIGTKLDLANDYNKLETIGIDLVAMNVNDLIACGFTPLFFMDYIAIDKMNVNKCNKIISGIKEGCRIAGCKLVGGETAEMSGIYFNDKFDVAGFAVGGVNNIILPQKELMDNNCVLYGLKSNGIHSNGYTLVRKLLKYNNYDIDEILKPTKIYTEVLEILEEYPNVLLGAAHITGGGFVDNIPRILPKNLKYKITHTWTMPNIFHWIQQKSNLSDNEMLKTFNCGIGMVLVLKQDYISSIIYNLVKKYDLVELGVLENI